MQPPATVLDLGLALPTDRAGAIAAQRQARASAVFTPLRHETRPIVAAAATVGSGGEHLFVAALRFEPESYIPTASRIVTGRYSMSYVRGLEFYREGHVWIDAISAVAAPGDLLLINGAGRCHPFECGIACELGVRLDRPSVGIARRLGWRSPPRLAEPAGSSAAIWSHGREVGRMIRTREGVKPLIVSPGHGITLEDSISLALRHLRGFRWPEPLRRAHSCVTNYQREYDRSFGRTSI